MDRLDSASYQNKIFHEKCCQVFTRHHNAGVESEARKSSGSSRIDLLPCSSPLFGKAT